MANFFNPNQLIYRTTNYFRSKKYGNLSDTGILYFSLRDKYNGDEPIVEYVIYLSKLFNIDYTEVRYNISWDKQYFNFDLSIHGKENTDNATILAKLTHG